LVWDSFSLSTTQSFSQENYKEILYANFSDSLSSFWSSSVLYSYSYNISINGIPADHLVGESWDLSWNSFLISLRNPISYYLKSRQSTVFIVPQSLSTILHVLHSSQKNNFWLLYILPDMVKYIVVRDGFYLHYETLNIWSNALRHMLGEVGLSWNNVFSIWQNPLAYKLLEETYWFFVSTIFEWLEGLSFFNRTIFLISNFTHDELFVTLFSEQFLSVHEWYVVPLWSSSILGNKKTSWYDDIDFSLYYNELLRKRIEWL
jgi:hypothetical protein